MPDAKSEMEALWNAVFGQPPPIDADPGLLAELILRCSGPLPLYSSFSAQRSPASSESAMLDACLPPGMTPDAA
jgi:hypothetical protein